MTGHGVSRSESEMAQKSWPSGAPTRAAAACSAEMPGARRSRRAAHAGSAGAVDQLDDQRRHGVDAGVAGADEGHPATLGGTCERVAAAFCLRRRAGRRDVAPLAGGSDEIEVEAVADELVGVAQAGASASAVRQSALPGPTPMTARRPRAVPMAGRIEDIGGLRHGAGDAIADPLRDDQPPLRPDGGQGGRFGHAPAAGLAEHDARNGCSAGRSLGQTRGGEEAGRVGARRMQGGLVGLQVDRHDAGDGGGCEAGLVEGGRDEVAQGLGRAPRSAPTPRASTCGW